MLKIAVCDDEILQRIDIVKNINEAMKGCCYNYDIEEFSMGDKLLSSAESFDIIFLDIKLGETSGIEIAKKMRESAGNSKIVFVTAFKEYVFEAFDVNAFNYIVKPVTKEKIFNVMDKALNAIKNQQDNEQCIVVNKGKSAIKILLSSIFFFEVQNRIIVIHTKNGLVQYYDKMSSLEEILPKDSFVRCHRSYIVNLEYVTKFDKAEIIMDNNEMVMLSKAKYSEFSGKFLKYLKTSRV